MHNLQSAGPTETDVSMEDATDEKSQHQPRKRRVIPLVVKTQKNLRTKGEKAIKVGMLELSFLLSFRCTDFDFLFCDTYNLIFDRS